MMQRAVRQLDRMDRHVERSFVRIEGEASRCRLQFALEEALRLACLPGEREGRIYCFRSVSLSGLSTQSARSSWISRVQSALDTMAAEALHASDARAASANAVYFHSQEEALETMLQSALRGRPAAWFALSMLQLQPGTSTQATVFAAVERLLQTFPLAAASSVIAASVEHLPNTAAIMLLESISETSARTWLRQLDNRAYLRPPNAVFATEASSVALSASRRSLIAEAGLRFGWQDPRTLWLALVLLAAETPSIAASGSAVQRARATVRTVEAEFTSHRERAANLSASGQTRVSLIFEDEITETTPQASSNGHTGSASDPGRRSESDTPTEMEPEMRASQIQTSRLTRARREPRRVLGEVTPSAGLYFLLHAIRRLGIADAVEASPALADADLAANVLRNLARRTGVSTRNPILLALDPAGDASPPGEFNLASETLAAMPPAAWPANLRPPTERPCTSPGLLRAWTLGVRRWCWHYAGMSIEEIVHRPGVVWSSRADIDVTLPLDQADLRIRRAGLDIDPGWLPWLGPYGRVVRFHYHQGQWPPASPSTDKEAR
jgi:hypothetical protein